MRLFRITGLLLIGAAALTANGCKTRGTEQLRSEGSGSTVGTDEQTTVSEDTALSAGIAPGALATDEGLNLAEALPPTAAASAAPVAWVLEKKDRFGNMYRLDTAGNLYRYFGGTLKCQVTNMVMDFKINLHPADESVAYLVRNEGVNNGVVYALMDSPTYGESQCPKSFKIKALGGLTGNVNDKYKIVSNLKDYELGTTATMMALAGNGDFVGWRGRSPLFYNAPGVYFGDLVMNVCYGTKSASFSSYVAFTLEKGPSLYHRVLKIKGRNTVAESKWDTKTWKNIQDFKAFYKVCSTGSDTYPPPPPPPKYLTKLVDCSSNQYKFAVCNANIGTGFIEKVALVKKYSVASCTAGVTYGSDSKSIWASDGCRGQFKVTYVGGYY